MKDSKVQLHNDDSQVFELYLQFLYTEKLPVKAISLKEDRSKGQQNPTPSSSDSAGDSNSEGGSSGGGDSNGETNHESDISESRSGLYQEDRNGELGKVAGHAYDLEIMPLCNLFVLAEKLQDVTAKNAIVDVVVATSNEKRADGCYWYPGPDFINVVYSGTSTFSPMRKLPVDFYINHEGVGVSTNRNYFKGFLVDCLYGTMDVRDYPKDTSKTNDGSNYHEKPKTKDC